jgi:hypothetical protein
MVGQAERRGGGRIGRGLNGPLGMLTILNNTGF